MAAKVFFLGIDIGTSGTKTVAMDAKGRVVASATVEYPCYQPKAGWSEQDPQDWWLATVESTRKILKQGIDGRTVAGIGFSGQMHGSVFLPKSGTKPLRRALLWNDQRTAAQCEEIESAAGGRKALIRLVNNVALTGFTAPKILWFRQHEPKKWDRCRHVLLPKDYIRLCMTGEYVTDAGDASGTLLLDVRKRQWSKKLLGKLHLDADLLPPVVEASEVTGGVTAQAAELLGVPAGTPVVGGSGDQPAGGVGAGITQPGIVNCALGTSGVVFAHAERPAANRAGTLQSFCHAVSGKWCVFGCMLSTGGSLQWLRDTFHPEQVERLRKAGRDPGDLYPGMIDTAAEAPTGAEGLFFLPYLTGERCPYPDPDARGAWVGLTSRHRREHLYRAVLEGISFGLRDQVELMRSEGVPVSQIRAAGGGARSHFWRQMLADMFHCGVVTINVTEGAALGAAILAAVGTGYFSTVPEACSALIKTKPSLTPQRRSAKLYDRSYSEYKQLYQSLRQDFKSISQLV